MGPDEPSRVKQDRYHQRILDKETTAFAELCDVALPYLISYLKKCFPQIELHLQETVAIDCLLEYKLNPHTYDPAKAPLLAYLKMAARMDMLNAIDKEKRRERHLSSLDEYPYSDQLPEGGTPDEHIPFDDWLQDHTQLSVSELLDGLDNFLDATEKKVLLLMLEGVRESDQYAGTLKLSQLDEKSRREEVKRVKDRLIKKLRRYGKTIKNT